MDVPGNTCRARCLIGQVRPHAFLPAARSASSMNYRSAGGLSTRRTARDQPVRRGDNRHAMTEPNGTILHDRKISQRSLRRPHPPQAAPYAANSAGLSSRASRSSTALTNPGSSPVKNPCATSRYSLITTRVGGPSAIANSAPPARNTARNTGSSRAIGQSAGNASAINASTRSCNNTAARTMRPNNGTSASGTRPSSNPSDPANAPNR